MPLRIRFHDTILSVCQLPKDSDAPAEILEHPFTAFFRTHDEATLICPSELVSQNAKAETGFIPLELVGPFAFNLTGVLAQVANPLAEAGVSIFVLSSFNTDYVLIKANQRTHAEAALHNAGHVFM